MRIVVLVGTDHKFQRPSNGPHIAEIEGFRIVIRKLCLQHEVRAIAEEMHPSALREHGVTESVAQQLCAELCLIHQFSDPSLEQRRQLGIRQENHIRIEGWQNGWTQEQIDAAVTENSKSDRIREREWLRKIQELDTWPLLFICGANHFTPFAILLRDTGMTVFAAFQDWGRI